jgi:hypothetical protein
LAKDNEQLEALSTMLHREYWDKPNTIEFFAFMIKLIIIIPGLLWGYNWWWLYALALVTSVMLIWSSTKKTLPTLIIFNFVWIFLSIFAIIKYY